MTSSSEYIILPYAGLEGKTLLDQLVRQLRSNRWKRFRAAVAFAQTSGNIIELLEAMKFFAGIPENEISLTFGGNLFGNEAKGTSYEAIKVLLETFHTFKNVHCYLYFEKGRTFHPKVYLFSNENEALVLTGSSNWTQGGLCNNIEANHLQKLDLKDPAQKKSYDHLEHLFHTYWTEHD